MRRRNPCLPRSTASALSIRSCRAPPERVVASELAGLSSSSGSTIRSSSTRQARSEWSSREQIMAKTPTIEPTKTAEAQRLDEAREQGVSWRHWGPYLSERQWGTVREDYSADGNAWDYFSHDQARSRAYHWGEDGLAGLSDDHQRLCFALALWNGKDPIIKERLFGLTNSEGNHGEDVKEYYYYLDSTPTHSYMK